MLTLVNEQAIPFNIVIIIMYRLYNMLHSTMYVLDLFISIICVRCISCAYNTNDKNLFYAISTHALCSIVLVVSFKYANLMGSFKNPSLQISIMSSFLIRRLGILHPHYQLHPTFVHRCVSVVSNY